MVKVITIGAAVQDVFLSHSDEFEPVSEKNSDELFLQLELGAKVDVNSISFSTGGGATNGAVTFARQGMEAQFVGVIGRDPAGQAVLDELDKENVDTSLVKYSDRYHTGYSVLLLAPSGERTILTYRGASTHYGASDIDIRDIDGDWLYLSTLNGNMTLLDKILRTAKKKDIKVFFNPGKGELSKPQELKALLDDIDVLSVNREEAKQLVAGEELEELIRHAIHLVPVAIISDGPNGVIASDGHKIIRAGMYKDVPVIDRTGAGDAFGSGFLSYWAKGKSLKDSIVFASANSTSVVTKVGAKAGILYENTKLHDMPITEEDF